MEERKVEDKEMEYFIGGSDSVRRRENDRRENGEEK